MVSGCVGACVVVEGVVTTVVVEIGGALKGELHGCVREATQTKESDRCGWNRGRTRTLPIHA